MISFRETRSPGLWSSTPEDVERARADFDRRLGAIFISLEQAAPVETEPLQQETRVRGKCLHAPALPHASDFGNILALFRTF